MSVEPSVNSHDQITEHVRLFCAERLYELEKTLRPWIDGSFGEVNPGHLNAYLSLLRQLGQLYQAHHRPHDDADSIPAKKVEALLHEAALRQETAVAAAVAETEARIRAELRAAQRLSIESAKATVSARLTQLEKRA